MKHWNLMSSQQIACIVFISIDKDYSTGNLTYRGHNT